MDNSNIFKVWGVRRRLLLTATSEIDLVTVNKDTFCSTHSHKYKINHFYVLSGKIQIQSEYGDVILEPGSSFEVRPSLKHRFFAIEDSTMIELAYVEEGKIDANDIDRESQGGRIIEDKAYTLDEMKEKGLLDLWEI